MMLFWRLKTLDAFVTDIMSAVGGSSCNSTTALYAHQGVSLKSTYILIYDEMFLLLVLTLVYLRTWYQANSNPNAMG